MNVPKPVVKTESAMATMAEHSRRWKCIKCGPNLSTVLTCQLLLIHGESLESFLLSQKCKLSEKVFFFSALGPIILLPEVSGLELNFSKPSVNRANQPCDAPNRINLGMLQTEIIFEKSLRIFLFVYFGAAQPIDVSLPGSAIWTRFAGRFSAI